MATPTAPAPEKKVVRRQAFNFDTFVKDSLAKNYVVPSPVASIKDALAESGNDEKALVALINKGRAAEAADSAWASNDGWTIAEKNLPGSVPFTGAIVSPGGVMTMVRTLAMTIFGMTPEMSKDEKKTRRAKAMEFIKANDGIKEGLKNQALASAAIDDAGDDDED